MPDLAKANTISTLIPSPINRGGVIKGPTNRALATIFCMNYVKRSNEEKEGDKYA